MIHRPISGGAGITYIELMMAISVLAVLATLALPTALTVHRRGQERDLRRGLEKIRAAIDEYHHDWERGYIESEHEHGWPETLEELVEPKEYTGPDPGGGPTPSEAAEGGIRRGLPGLPRQDDAEPTEKTYLRRIPRDPFNSYDDPWDVSGWRARCYDDEPDDSSWCGEAVYDVYSSSDRSAIDGRSRYEEW